MSAGGSFGGARGYQPRPPEKGVFPLDHFGECKHVKEEYLECLKTKGQDATACNKLSEKYLECRMSRNLMVKQELSELGLGEAAPVPRQEESVPKEQQRQQRPFVAGLRLARDRQQVQPDAHPGSTSTSS